MVSNLTSHETRTEGGVSSGLHEVLQSFDFCYLPVAIANRFSSILTIFNVVILFLVEWGRRKLRKRVLSSIVQCVFALLQHGVRIL
jgi:hypothetical protein